MAKKSKSKAVPTYPSMSQYEAEDAARTLLSAQKVKENSKLHASAKKHLKQMARHAEKASK